MFRILAISAALLGLASVAQADVYRWVDTSGVVQYSDKWVPGSVLVKTDKNHGAQPVPTQPAPSAPASNLSRADEIIAQEREKRTVAADVAKSRADQCKKAQENYDKAIQSRRIYKQGADGSKDYIPDAEADAYRAQLLTIRNKMCGT